MASMEIRIGQNFVVSIAAADAAAADVLAEYADSLGVGGTAQEKGEAVLLSLVEYMRRESGRHKRAVAQAVARYDPANQGTKWT